MGKDYGSWSLGDLKAELKKRNAKLSGKKAVLVKRLEDYDKLFGELVNNPGEAFKIVIPNPEHFRDITSDSNTPAFTKDDLEAFCVLTERKNVDTSRNLYEQNFLKVCRTMHTDGDYYVAAVCSSEMRKNVSYNIVVKCRDHLVIEAQCECAAGAGPYGQCKHILVALNAMIDFQQTKTIKVKSSSTSVLQTFHHPSQSYTGNPIMAEKLTLSLKNKKLDELPNYDPRPSHCRPNSGEYNTRFQNLVSNYFGQVHNNANASMVQILKPANKEAVFADHDYLAKTAEENFFESLELNEEEITELQKRTNIDIKEWAKQRTLRLQSSNFGKICKQKSNLLNLAKSLVKINEIQAPAIKHGRKYEPEAIKAFEKITGQSVIKTGIIVHPELQYLGSTPDGLVGDSEVLEVKCPYTARHKNISGDSVPYLYLCEKSGKLKLTETHDYYYQVQGQLFCANKDMANLFVFTLCDAYLVRVKRDNVFIQEMIQKLHTFYETYFKKVLLTRYLYKKNYRLI